MDREELLSKITEKKEFSKLPKKDVEKIFDLFDKDSYTDNEKLKLTRNLLRKVYSVFTSTKLLKIKNNEPEWFLKKHISTKERFGSYEEIYSRILSGMEKEDLTIFDLGAGVNGFSFNYLNFLNKKRYYVAVEAMGQLVELMNYYFKTRGIENAQAFHKSLFDLEFLKKIMLQVKEKKIVFLFKTLDSLEMVERDFSKKLLNEITPLLDKVVVSFATKSIGKRKNFYANRNWLVNFLKENFKILDDFEISGERYIIFKS